MDRVEACTDYIAADDIQAAVKWAQGAFELCQQLAAHHNRAEWYPSSEDLKSEKSYTEIIG
ncbi:hypothetical protein CYPRO_0587 [Cyclonatronum proteinivorum]|uniref:HEPN domain-containing protein n=1 Tax=Cyclonatronum proteinivorum TaxID=1457365 RepID=A0A345UHC0_9BACT|nr:hypothetical protein [Cyclonatronum proteinivorum]AXI99871.1 hypothetical protein CYPRO_0587 [Cyclonatronum proteinivorum]